MKLCCAGFRLRSSLTHRMYNQVLTLSPQGRNMHSSGRIFNMVTSDVEMLQQLCQSIMGIVSSPLRIIIAMLLLYLQLGPSALIALAVLCLTLPLQVCVHPCLLCCPPAFLSEQGILLFESPSHRLLVCVLDCAAGVRHFGAVFSGPAYVQLSLHAPWMLLFGARYRCLHAHYLICASCALMHLLLST